jgi:putative ATP-dependent endonuclease of the OLD family
MYLKSLHITNFRGIKEATIHWHRGVNVLVGENNAGKTAVLDALRMSLAFGDTQRDIWVRREDFHVSPAGEIADVIQFDLSWGCLTDEEKGVYADMLVLPSSYDVELQFHVRFGYDQERDRPKRPVYWGGEKEGQSITPDVLDLFEHVYLGALRDATRDLAPGRGNQLSRLFLKLASKRKGQEKLATQINEQIRNMKSWRRFLDRGKRRINEHLTEVSLQGSPQYVDVDFVETQFRQIVEGLRLQFPGPIPASGVPSFFNIRQNGLGYNNLVYVATVFGDLLKRRQRFPYASVSLIIEEPEAHLHPQLQNVLFAYLGNIAERGIQVFLSSHSPTVTAKTPLDSLIILCSDNGQAASTPVNRIALTTEQKQLLERFLDVTKCQLFFAKSVLLVEGISEALLLPHFARTIGPDFQLDKCGAEVINICGVAFAPFARLFNSKNPEERLGIRCAMVTDDDRAESASGDGEEASNRATKAKQLESGLLRIVLAKHTFEYELFLSNETLVVSTYQDLHPQTNLDFTGTPEEKADAFMKKIHDNNDKAVFAQALAAKVQKDSSATLKTPAYIEKAIRWAVKGEWQVNRGAPAH